MESDLIERMPRPAGGSDVSPEALRTAVLILIEEYDEWRFAAHGRAGLRDRVGAAAVDCS